MLYICDFKWKAKLINPKTIEFTFTFSDPLFISQIGKSEDLMDRLVVKLWDTKLLQLIEKKKFRNLQTISNNDRYLAAYSVIVPPQFPNKFMANFIAAVGKVTDTSVKGSVNLMQVLRFIAKNLRKVLLQSVYSAIIFLQL